jgi:AAA domain
MISRPMPRHRSPDTIDSYSSSARPAPARPRCCERRWPISNAKIGPRSVWPRPPKPLRCSGARPGLRATQSRSYSTSGLALTVRRKLRIDCRLARPLSLTKPGCSTRSTFYTLTHLAERNSWRLALVGDPRQLSAVGRGGMFDELCATGRVVELQRVHRFTEPWEASASLGLRRGDPRALGSYEGHGRVVAGPLAEHIGSIADRWLADFDDGRTLAITTTTNTHVDQINDAIQSRRVDRGDLHPDVSAEITDRAFVYVGDIIATRRNERRLRTGTNEPVRNRDLWTVTAIDNGGSLTVTKLHGHGTATLPPGYVIDHVRLGYAATEYGHQSITTDASVTLATGATTCRGLYVAMSRGRHDNTVHVVTDTHDVAEARDTLERILANDRADLPAVSQRHELAAQDHAPAPPRPRLTPRCTVPPWFDDLLRNAQEDIEAVRQLMSQTSTRRHELDVALIDAERIAEVRTRNHAPFAAALSASSEALDESYQARYRADRELRESGRLTRGGARRRLQQADDVVKVSLSNVAHAIEVARPTGSTLQIAEQDLSRIKGAIRQLDYAERHDYPQQLHTLQRRVDALQTWHEWAIRQDIPTEQAINVATELAATNDRRAAPLVEPLESWLVEQGIEPPSRSRRVDRSLDFGIEI